MHSCLFSIPPLLGAALPPRPGLGESIVFQINGLVVVFLALASIWGVLELTGLFFRRRAVAKPAVKAAAPLPASPRAADASGLPPETVAVIAAAVHAAVGAPHRIEVIVPVGPSSDWAREGRRQIFASHQVR